MRIDRVKFITEMARADLKVYELSERAGVHKNTVVNVKGARPVPLPQLKSWLPVWAFPCLRCWRNEVTTWLIC